MPRVLAVLTSDPLGPVVRHRWVAYEEALAAADVALEVVPWPKDVEGRAAALRQVAGADATVVSSRLLTKRDVARVRGAAPRLGFDFDDALLYRANGSKSLTRRRRFRAILAAADRVTAGNTYLAELAAAAGATARVMPTTVEVPETPPPQPSAEDGIVLGWIGSRATVGYLDQLEPVMLEIADCYDVEVSLHVIADGLPKMDRRVAMELVPWAPDTWQDALAATHMGIATLPTDRWTRGKCGLKVLQMLSLARPVVANPVGVQREQVRHDVTGLLAEADELLEAIVALAEDPERRERMGKAGWEDARTNWSVAAWSPRVVAEVDALLA